jgi:hypothetical protein
MIEPVEVDVTEPLVTVNDAVLATRISPLSIKDASETTLRSLPVVIPLNSTRIGLSARTQVLKSVA